ncbi:efflux transporter outer membrane subunit [Geomonas ferrireducens]|uniref:efflux transporter outer membrane subunit n=1 Tax=Geomonas ferrireducens TaxID=2570227 RepID=UPI0018E06DB3|nr:efflux transporter outer membrane subunit [Geomonas ferrireducens]
MAQKEEGDPREPEPTLRALQPLVRSLPRAVHAFMHPRRLFFTLAAIVTAAALVGCSLKPAYQRPALPVPQQYPGVSDRVAAAGAPASWSVFFTDPELKHLLFLAHGNNRDLRVARAKVEEARALYGIRRADLLPAISAGAGLERSRTPADLSVTGGAMITDVFSAGLFLAAWELDFWGRLRDLKEGALETYLATEEARRAVQVSLTAQVAQSYLQERELAERVSLAEATIASREESWRIARRRYEVGSASKLDAVQAETLLNQARAELSALKRLRALNLNALGLLVGGEVHLDPLPLSTVEEGFLAEIPSGLPSELLLYRPDVIAAEHELKSANAAIGAARAAFFPAIALTGNFGTASSALSGLFTSGSGAWSFAPAISVPIFQGGRNVANLEFARAREKEAVAQYERVVQRAFREVADALAQRRWLAEQVQAQRTTLAAQTERTRLARLRYDTGAAPYLEVLDAERDRFAAQQALVQTRRAILAAGVDLYAALGGGGGEGAGGESVAASATGGKEAMP